MDTNVETEVVFNKKTMKALDQMPDDIVYSIAVQTLDMSIPVIPQSEAVNHKGTLRRKSKAGGVRGSDGDYFIGSYTNYASYVWAMNDETTNWTTPGTHSQWYTRVLKENGQVIIDNAINQTWKDNV